MKQFKLIICLLVLVAFVTSCENESINTVDETSSVDVKTGFKQLNELPAEKAALFQGFDTNGIASRVPFTYEGQLCPGEVASGETVNGSIYISFFAGDHWYFTAEAGDLLTFEVNRTNCNSDPYMEIYFGDGDTDDLQFLGLLDDEADPSCTPDCFAFGDPYFVDAVAPFTGVYTVGVWDWASLCGFDPMTYDIVISGQNACVINIDGCDTGVANQFVGDSNMDQMIDNLEAGSYRNHGQFVRTVAHLVNQWYNDGLITLEEKDAIMSCAGQSNIPS